VPTLSGSGMVAMILLLMGLALVFLVRNRQ